MKLFVFSSLILYANLSDILWQMTKHNDGIWMRFANTYLTAAYPLRKLHLRGDGPCGCSCSSCCCCCCCCWCWCWGVDLGVWLPGLPAIPSRPLDSLSISAPKAWRADMAEGGGSLSGSQSSWVSRVVSSVSVDVPEVCCGVPPLPPELLFRRYLFQVPRRSSPANWGDQKF